jgi:hypothetical protein
MKKYYRIYLETETEKNEIARFNSKGVMAICLKVLRETYKNVPEVNVTHD